MAYRRRYRKWEQRELAVVGRAVVADQSAKDIEHLLPGRSREQVRNALNAARRKLRGERGRTDKSRSRQRADREARVRQGLCCLCGRLADDDGTLTKCSQCRHDRGEYMLQDKTAAQKNEADLLPWIYSRVPGNLAAYLPKDARTVVDLFAGSGRFARAANRRGFDVVYNDVHRLLAVYTRAVRDRRHAEINLATTEMVMDIRDFRSHYRSTYRRPSDIVEAAATARLAAFNVPRGCHLDETEVVRFAPLASDADAGAWANMDVTDLDYREAIKEHDRRRTVFFVDPPYPGTTYYEHNLSWRQFGNMLSALREVKGDVLMVLPTQRRTVKMAAEAGFHLHLRLLRTPRFQGRDLLVSTRPIPRSRYLEPFDPDQFGLGARDELDEDVRRVVESLRGNARGMTRGQLEKALGINGHRVFGAISRARAEGAVVRKGRERYCVAAP